MMGTTITLNVNGKAVTRDSRGAAPCLSEFLREDPPAHRHAHVGCDTAQCGACTVHLNGRAVKSLLDAGGAGRMAPTSPPSKAGRGSDGKLAPDAGRLPGDCHGLQCGFCTPGMVMSAIDLVQNHDCSSEAEIREGLEGNLCRCTGYQNIVKAVQQGRQGHGA